MPNDPRHELHTLPEMTADEVRNLGDRAAVENQERRAQSFDRIRKAHAVLKRAEDKTIDGRCPPQRDSTFRLAFFINRICRCVSVPTPGWALSSG
jgi:hypothetical protein